MLNETTRGYKLTSIVQTLAIAAGMVLLIALVSTQLLGIFGIGSAVVTAAFIAWSVFRTSTPQRIANAVPLNHFNAPEVLAITSNLARRAGLPKNPKLYVVHVPVLNALTFGSRDQAHIVVTHALIDSLTPRELAGVLAHEIAHIRNRDLSLFRLIEVVRQVTMFMSRFGWILLIFAVPFMMVSSLYAPFSLILLLLGAPAVSLLLQLALFRTREFNADMTAAELTGDPRGLAQALYKIDQPRSSLVRLFMPVPQRQESSLLRTHPDSEERIRRLLAIAER